MSNRFATRKPFMTALILTAAIFVALAIVLEGIARTPWVENALPYRSFGEYQSQFELKWFLLEKYVIDHGGVDVIVLGNSEVNTGIDPDVLAQTYLSETGGRLRVFNFGVNGLTVAPNSVVAKILVARYHPTLLIFVTEMRDYAAGNGLDAETQFLNNPWLRYQSGDFNLAGWAIDHSAALQEYLPYRNWVRSDYFSFFSDYQELSRLTSASGYEPDSRVGKGIDLQPDPNNPADAANFQAFQDYQPDLTRVSDLVHILALGQDKKTAVLVVEMPVYSTAFTYFGGETVHTKFQQVMATIVKSNGGLFIPWGTCYSMSLKDRSDRWHLNYLGAPIFSACLGNQLTILSALPASILYGLKSAGSK